MKPRTINYSILTPDAAALDPVIERLNGIDGARFVPPPALATITAWTPVLVEIDMLIVDARAITPALALLAVVLLAGPDLRVVVCSQEQWEQTWMPTFGPGWGQGLIALRSMQDLGLLLHQLLHPGSELPAELVAECAAPFAAVGPMPTGAVDEEPLRPAPGDLAVRSVELGVEHLRASGCLDPHYVVLVYGMVGTGDLQMEMLSDVDDRAAIQILGMGYTAMLERLDRLPSGVILPNSTRTDTPHDKRRRPLVPGFGHKGGRPI